MADNALRSDPGIVKHASPRLRFQCSARKGGGSAIFDDIEKNGGLVPQVLSDSPIISIPNINKFNNLWLARLLQ